MKKRSGKLALRRETLRSLLPLASGGTSLPGITHLTFGMCTSTNCPQQTETCDPGGSDICTE